MLDRTKPPKINTDFDIQIKNLEYSKLANGIGLIELNSGTQDIVKLEIVLRSGRINEKVIGSAKAAFHLVREGSSSRNSKQIAEALDYYGAYIKINAGIEYSSISLVCLSRFFLNVWPIWLEMVMQPSFENEELYSAT